MNSPATDSSIRRPPAAPVAAELSELAQRHRAFASLLQRNWSVLCGTSTSVQFRSGEVVPYGQFVFGHPIPTCAAIIEAAPVHTPFVWVLEPGLLLTMLDRFVGSPLVGAAEQRPLTEIERRLTAEWLRGPLEHYSDLWQQAMDFRVDSFQHNLQRSTLLSGADTVYLATYDVHQAPARGRLTICVPWSDSAQIRQRLTTSL